MRKIFAVIVICCFITPVKAQVLKKIKDQFEGKFKEKLEQKKNQKIDEKTDNAASKIINAPDSVIKKSGNFIKEKQQNKKDSLKIKEQQKTDTLINQVSRTLIITAPGFSSPDTGQALPPRRNATVNKYSIYVNYQLKSDCAYTNWAFNHLQLVCKQTEMPMDHVKIC